MVTEKEKRRLRLYGAIIVLVSVLAFFFGQGRGVLAEYPYLVWGVPMLALGVVIVIISYFLPSNEASGKKKLQSDSKSWKSIQFSSLLFFWILGFGGKVLSNQPKTGFLQLIFVKTLGSCHSSLRMLYVQLSLHSPLTKYSFRKVPSFLNPTFSRTF